MVPTFELLMVHGKPKLARLRALNTSQRKSTYLFSAPEPESAMDAEVEVWQSLVR